MRQVIQVRVLFAFLASIMIIAVAQEVDVSIGATVLRGGVWSAVGVADPGETLKYKTMVNNISPDRLPSGVVLVTLPIPDRITYIIGSLNSPYDYSATFYDRAGQEVALGPTGQADIGSIKWTLAEPLPIAASVYFEFQAVVKEPPAPSVGSEEIERHILQVFGEMGIFKVDCPSQIAEAGGAICGISDRSYERFRDGWDFYSSYDEVVDVEAKGVGAWELDSDEGSSSISRFFEIGGTHYSVLYSAGIELVVIVPR